jgi:hypothetical protein
MQAPNLSHLTAALLILLTLPAYTHLLSWDKHHTALTSRELQMNQVNVYLHEFYFFYLALQPQFGPWPKKLN